MNTIKFANGAVYDCSFLSTIPNGSENEAIIALTDVDFPTAATVFSDKNMTSVMEWGSYRLVGYTNLIAVGVQPYGIQAVLRGGHDERIN